MSKSLQVALRLQRQAIEIARHDLAKCLALGFGAFEQEKAAQAAILREAEASTRVEAADATVEAFVAWLPRARQAVDTARCRRSEAEVAIAVARATLFTALAAEAGTTSLVRRRKAMEQARAARAAEKVAEEAAQRTRFS